MIEPSGLETRVRPRLEFEEFAAPRLEALPVVVASVPTAPIGSAALAAGGVGVLAVGMAALSSANFVASQFERGTGLGILTLAVAIGGFGLIIAALWRELRGLYALHAVDRVRRALRDPATAQGAALAWLRRLDDAAGLAESLRAVREPDAIAALLRAGPVATLRARAEGLGRTAALQVFAAAAAVPSPALDGLLVGWRGVRLVREIAELHGVRPGALATLALLRRTAFAAAGVMATDMALDAATRALLSNPLLAHVVGDVAGAGVAARRMIVLARAAAAACEPLGPD